MRLTFSLPAFAALSLALLLPQAASAQALGISDSFNTIVTSFSDSVSGFGTNLAAYAREIMGVLVVLEFIFTIGRIVMANGDLGTMLKELMMRMILVGGFIWLTEAIPAAGGLADFVTQFAGSMFNAGSGHAATTVTPGSLFIYAWQAGAEVYDQSSGFGIVGGVFVFVLCVAIGAVLAAELIVTIVEIHIVFAGAIVALGFAPWSETRSLARNVLFAAIGSAFKLFGMLLIGAVAVHLLSNFSAPSSSTGAIKFGLLIFAEMLVLALCALQIPKALEMAVMSGAGAGSGAGFFANAAGSAAGSLVGSAAGTAVGVTWGLAKAGGAAAAGWAMQKAGFTAAPTRDQSAAATEAINSRLEGGSNGGSA